MADDKAQEALLAARDANTKLDSHEKVCAERYGDIKDSFGRVHDRLDKIIYGLVALLIAMAGWLIVNGTPWAK